MGLVLRLFAGRLVLAVRGGLLGVYDEAAEAVVAAELLHRVVHLSVTVAVHVGAELWKKTETERRKEDETRVCSSAVLRGL